VSSRLLGKIAEWHGIAHRQTLTGFKWISRVPGLSYGYEEALGYCAAPDLVKDKDGISAALLIAELAADSLAKGRTLQDELDELQLAHGIHATDQLAVRVGSLDLLDAMMHRLRENPQLDLVPRTVIFAGKAAPGYYLAKSIIRLINNVARVVNDDRTIGGKLRVVFLPDYDVSLAQRIMPAADLSEQISTAGMEASGTGNMKLALNGALTIGTLDGANIEICEAVGAENIFIFGLTAEEVAARRRSGYSPSEIVAANPELAETIDLIDSGHFSPGNLTAGRPVVERLLSESETFFVLADFAAYAAAQDAVDALYRDTDAWTRKAATNTLNMGVFSSDRSVREYAQRIWRIKPVL
jgi:starch phosphorylase